MQNNFDLPDFSDLHIVVIGDVMIDRYISGSVKRISPEAPVPVVELQQSENRLGGAANVALNLIALGAKVTLISIIGDDNDGTSMVEMLKNISRLDIQLQISKGRKTTIKTRVMAGNQQLLRIDSEDTSEISGKEEDKIIDILNDLLKRENLDGIILQDYNKGLLTEPLIYKLITLANLNHIPTYVDPKEKNFFAYKNCTLFKPNKREVIKALGEATYPELDRLCKEKIQNKITLITLGSQGLYMSDERGGRHFTTKARKISDVCGAGDSVISIVCLCHIKGVSLEIIAQIANIAGGQVCEQPGVVALNIDTLRSELTSQKE